MPANFHHGVHVHSLLLKVVWQLMGAWPSFIEHTPFKVCGNVLSCVSKNHCGLKQWLWTVLWGFSALQFTGPTHEDSDCGTMVLLLQLTASLLMHHEIQ